MNVEKELTLKEIFDRIQIMFGYDMEKEKVTEFGMRSLISDIFESDTFDKQS